MQWAQFLSVMLEGSDRVDKAAIFNTKGQPLATTEDLQVSEQDGRALLLCLHDPARSLTRLTLDEMDFRCFQGNSRALVGKATNTSGRVLVACLTDEALILVIGNASGHGSFLYEIQKNLAERQRRQMAPQAAAVSPSGVRAGREGSRQMTQPLKPSLPLPQSPAAVQQEEVLVQLHD